MKLSSSCSSLQIRLGVQIWVRGPGALDFEEYTIDRRPLENVFDITDGSRIDVAVGGIYEIMQHVRRLTHGLKINAVILGDHLDEGVGTVLYAFDQQESIPLSRRRSSNNRPSNNLIFLVSHYPDHFF
jgi:hypothetical protein